MEIKFDEEKELENINSINILNKQYCFIIKQEYSKIIISLCKDSKNIYAYFKNKKINSNIFFAFINYKKKLNDYEIIIRLYNIYGKENNDVKYNELLELRRLIIFNKKILKKN